VRSLLCVVARAGSASGSRFLRDSGARECAMGRIIPFYVRLAPPGIIGPILLHHLPAPASAADGGGIQIRVLGRRDARAPRETSLFAQGLSRNSCYNPGAPPSPRAAQKESASFPRKRESLVDPRLRGGDALSFPSSDGERKDRRCLFQTVPHS